MAAPGATRAFRRRWYNKLRGLPLARRHGLRGPVGAGNPYAQLLYHASVTPPLEWQIAVDGGPCSRTEAGTIMTSDTTNPALDANAAPGALPTEAAAPPPAPTGAAETDTAKTDTADKAQTDTAQTDKTKTGKGKTATRQPPDSSKVAFGWWPLAIVAVAAAAWLSVVVARQTHFTTGHRAAAAWTALLVVAALAVLAQVILLSYQARLLSAAGDAPDQPTLAFRRRGLKAAVMGQDGRASTSKTQVVLWTGALVWALTDLLLLARAYPGGSLFLNAVKTNWHPEYLVLLGLPVAAATTAKAVVAGANSGQGPATSDSSSASSIAKIASGLDGNRVYVRDPISAGVWGFLRGVAELFTGDDDAVSWADLQYVVFTMITLVYFASQFLAQPAAGLPQVPAALLTLMGVSATGYAANKIVGTKVNTQDAPADGQ
jgi:hypothetical protein